MSIRRTLRASLVLAILVALSGVAQAQGHQQAIAKALAHVKKNAAELGLEPRDVAGLSVSDAYVSGSSGVTHVYFQQQHQGVPVHNALLSAAVLPDGTVAHVSSRLIPALASKIAGAGPGLSARGAAEAAARHLGLRPSGPFREISRGNGGERRTTLSPAGLASDPVEARLVYYPTEGGEVRLTWQVTVGMTPDAHVWRLRLDASSGEVLDQRDLVVRDSWTLAGSDAPDALPSLGSTPAAPEVGPAGSPVEAGAGGILLPDSYRVYPFPFENPLQTGHTVVANPLGNAPTGTYPAGVTSWHDTNGDGNANFTDTRGNNVDAYADRDGDNVPDAGSRPSGGASLDFDFAIDLTAEPETYTAGAVVNLFYWSNIIHDVMYQYGFDEVAGNFQVSNFGRGGADGDDVRAEAQDADDVDPPDTGNCNANFWTPADGARPIMQMYQCDNTSPERDSDLNAGTVIHEYGHGISNRLTGGPSEDECLENDEQMGEGWSDFFATMLTQQAGQTINDPRPYGTYHRGLSPTGNGLRARAYSTDMSVNEFTFDNIKGTGSPHALGHVWATMLWDLNWALIGDLFPEEGPGASGGSYGPGFNADLYSGNGGNNLTLQLVMDGLKLQGCSPGFIEGRNAILAADVLLTGGANERLIWKTFARRGLGWSADQGADSDNRNDGTEAFDMPPHLNRDPVADAGEDQTAECTDAEPGGTEVTLDGSASSDPDETNPEPDVLAYSWSGPFPEGGGTVTGVSPSVTLVKGVHAITLTVTDEHGATDTDEVQITIADTEPPVITLNGDNPQILECAIDDYLEPGATAYDVCDGDLSTDVTIDASDVDLATPGTYEVHYAVLDDSGNEGTATRTVEVVDTTPPDLTVNSGPMSLWPPNHKYHPVDLDDLDMEASDVCDLTVDSEDVRIALAESDEYEEVPEPGDGETYDDIVIDAACRSVAVRAERVQNGNGRVYGLGLAVADASGNVSDTVRYEAHVPAQVNLGPLAVLDVPALYVVEGCDPVPEALAAEADEAKPQAVAQEGAADPAPQDASVEPARAETSADVPTAFVLEQNYPNPFQSETRIRFGLPESGPARLEVFDVVGRRVAVLADATLAAGYHTVAWDANGAANGVYVYRLTAGPVVEIRRLTLHR